MVIASPLMEPLREFGSEVEPAMVALTATELVSGVAVERDVCEPMWRRGS